MPNCGISLCVLKINANTYLLPNKISSYQKLFCPFTVLINCSSDLKIFKNSRPSASNFKSFSRSLEQFFLTVGQNNFGNKIPFFFKKLITCNHLITITHVNMYIFVILIDPFTLTISQYPVFWLCVKESIFSIFIFVYGVFQLLDLVITELKSHMTC